MDTALTNKPASGEEKNLGMVGQCFFGWGWSEEKLGGAKFYCGRGGQNKLS